MRWSKLNMNEAFPHYKKKKIPPLSTQFPYLTSFCLSELVGARCWPPHHALLLNHLGLLQSTEVEARLRLVQCLISTEAYSELQMKSKS